MYTAHSLDLFLSGGVMHLNILYFGWDCNGHEWEIKWQAY